MHEFLLGPGGVILFDVPLVLALLYPFLFLWYAGRKRKSTKPLTTQAPSDPSPYSDC